MSAESDSGAAGLGHFDTVAPTPGQPHAEVFAEVVEALVHALRDLGHEVDVLHGRYGPAKNLLISTAFVRESLPQPPQGTIVYNFEAFDANSPWFPDAVRTLLARHVVFDYSAKNLRNLQAAGMASRGVHVPLGYAPPLTRIEPAAEQDIDVLFYGSMNARRDTVLRDLGRRGLKVFHAFNAYGERRDALIARAKVVLNIHYYDARVFEMVRVSYLLANRKAVVSEVGPDTDIDADLVDAVEGVPYDRVADAVEALVRDDARRHGLETRGYEAFRRRPQSASLARGLAYAQV